MVAAPVVAAAARSFCTVCSPIVPSAAAALCLVVFLFCGVTIGATGVGGVAVVPMLGLIDVPVKEAVHAVMAAYIVTGLVQTSLWAYKGSLAGRDAVVLCIASLPASVLGGLAVSGAPAPMLTLLTALLASASGMDSLVKAWRARSQMARADGSVRLLSPTEEHVADSGSGSPAEEHAASSSSSGPATEGGSDDSLSCGFQACLGATVGFGSAVTGTGGPFLLLPLLFLCHPQLPVLRSVGLAQALPLPIALSATVANSWFACVDICIAAQLAGCIAPGVPIGVWLAHRIDNHRLRIAVSALLTIIGGASLIQLAAGWLHAIHPKSEGSGSDGNDSLVIVDYF